MNHEPTIERVFCELSQIEPEDGSAQRAIERARQAVLTQPRASARSIWGGAITGRHLAAAAGLLVAISLSAWLALGGSKRTVAFAEVLQRLDAVKTVEYLETRSHIPREGEPQGPTIVTRVQTLGRYRERKEIVSVTPGEELGKGRRWTQGPELEGHVSIVDLESGKMISLTPKDKRYHVVETIFGISPDDGSLHESKVKPMPEADFYQQMRSVPMDDAEMLAERMVEGKRVIGYRTVQDIERQGDTETWTRVYWVDPRTKLPVRIEHEYSRTFRNRGQSRWVLSDFVFDAPLDESLFSTDPPAGYTNARESAANEEEGDD